jgi:uncharacterized protein
MSVDADPADDLPPLVLTAPLTPGPVAPAERVTAVDVLRGVALLGILPMNIVGFAWPFAAYFDPTAGGGFEGLDRVIWIVCHLVFDQKMLTIFSMLFGAGLVLMGDRAEARGRSLTKVYYRRVLWLLVIGMIHAYLIWDGDILITYAQCGLLLYLFRRKSPRTLIVLGACLILVAALVGFAISFGIEFVKDSAAIAAAAEKVGERPPRFRSALRTVWDEDLRADFAPTPEERAKKHNEEIAVYRGGYLGIVRHRVSEVVMMQTVGFVLFMVWGVGGRMLMGMGLMKLGVFAAARPARFYGRLIVLGYGLGLPLVTYDTFVLINEGFAGPALLRSKATYNEISSVLVALGHVGVVMLAARAGALPWLTSRLAAVGRMALTNYLTHSLVCTTIFYGYGFGLFATINRTGLMGIVLAIWAVQLMVSPLWLAHFRFGPAEWVWRSLTYWRPQPMRQIKARFSHV